MNEMKNMQPLGDRVLVQPIAEDNVSAGGVVIPDSVRELPQRGLVLSVGPGPRDKAGNHLDMDLAEGDEVYYSKYGGTEIKQAFGEDMLILREQDVLAKVVG